jgi:hypothetical protein
MWTYGLYASTYMVGDGPCPRPATAPPHHHATARPRQCRMPWQPDKGEWRRTHARARAPLTGPLARAPPPRPLPAPSSPHPILQAANVIDTSCEWAEVPSRLPKFLGTTPVNLFLVIQKDIAFAHLFGTKVPHAMPKASLALFAIRDSHTVAASFLLPPLLGAWLHDNGYTSKRAHGEIALQLMAPAMAQVRCGVAPTPPLRSPRLPYPALPTPLIAWGRGAGAVGVGHRPRSPSSRPRVTYTPFVREARRLPCRTLDPPPHFPPWLPVPPPLHAHSSSPRRTT